MSSTLQPTQQEDPTAELLEQMYQHPQNRLYVDESTMDEDYVNAVDELRAGSYVREVDSAQYDDQDVLEISPWMSFRVSLVEENKSRTARDAYDIIRTYTDEKGTVSKDTLTSELGMHPSAVTQAVHPLLASGAVSAYDGKDAWQEWLDTFLRPASDDAPDNNDAVYYTAGEDEHLNDLVDTVLTQ